MSIIINLLHKQTYVLRQIIQIDQSSTEISQPEPIWDQEHSWRWLQISHRLCLKNPNKLKPPNERKEKTLSPLHF